MFLVDERVSTKHGVKCSVKYSKLASGQCVYVELRGHTGAEVRRGLPSVGAIINT